MAKATAPEEEPHPDEDGWLGDFSRGPAVFSVYRLPGVPLSTPEYRIDCNDGAGPRTISRFTASTDDEPEWLGSWQGDHWCGWILERARRLTAQPENT